MKCPSIIFDIDGTLIDSFKISGEVYKQSILTILPDARIRDQWREYRDVTDSGIIKEVLSDNESALPEAVTIDQIKEVFMQEITTRLTETPCREIPGARDFLKGCHQRFQKVGIATGCWRDSGQVKLSTAGYETSDLVMSSSCDHFTRGGILQHCLLSLSGSADEVVYFGDADWDLKTTDNLGWNFIGIGEKLRGKCPHWFADYSDPDQILRKISEIC